MYLEVSFAKILFFSSFYTMILGICKHTHTIFFFTQMAACVIYAVLHLAFFMNMAQTLFFIVT